MEMFNIVDTKTSNSFWNNQKISFNLKFNVIQYHTNTLGCQQIAFRNGKASSPSCPLCRGCDNPIHVLSGCQRETMRKMVIERQNIAARHIVKAITGGDYEENGN